MVAMITYRRLKPYKYAWYVNIEVLRHFILSEIVKRTQKSNYTVSLKQNARKTLSRLHECSFFPLLFHAKGTSIH